MSANSPPPISDLLCYKLYSTSLRMTQLYKPLLEALNLTYPQFLVMVVLWEEEGIGMKDLADRMGLDAGSVTPLVKRLEANGYVIRSVNPHDERNRILTLSKAGKELRKAGRDANRQVIAQCSISAATAGSLMTNLNELHHKLGDALGEP